MKLPLIPVFLLALTSCQTPKSETKSATTEASADQLVLTEAQEKSFGIALGSILEQPVIETIQVTGTIDALPQGRASVSFPVVAYVQTVAVVPGGAVRRGQVLATVQGMELVELQQGFFQTQAQLVFLDQERQRQRKLSAEDVGSKRKLQETEANYKTSQALLNALKAKLLLVGIDANKLADAQLVSTLPVRSPIDGVVQAINVNVGKIAQPTDVLFEIDNPQNTVIRLNVFEADVAKVTKNQVCQVTLGDKTRAAHLTVIGRNYNPATRTVDVLATFDAPVSGLSVGQYVTAQIQTKRRVARTLPQDAVVREGELASVFVKLNPGKYQKIIVKTGVEQGNAIEIVSTDPVLMAGKIVQKGAKLLAAEMSKAGDEE